MLNDLGHGIRRGGTMGQAEGHLRESKRDRFRRRLKRRAGHVITALVIAEDRMQRFAVAFGIEFTEYGHDGFLQCNS